MSKHHDLKCFPPHFQPIMDGLKTFEIRKNDRGFQTGDTFTLHEYEYDHGDKYSGRKISGRIGHINNFSQQPGYIVFSLMQLGLMIIK